MTRAWTGLRLALVAVASVVATSAQAQPPAPPPEPPTEEQPAEDGPKPAGVGTGQPPPEEPEAPLGELPPTSFPGVPLSGLAPSARPYGNLFGGAEPASRLKHSLTLTGSVFAGYSTDVALLDEIDASEPDLGQSSALFGGSGSVNYTRNWRSGGVSAFLNGSRSWAEAYSDSNNAWLSRWDTGVSAGFVKDLGRRTRATLRANVMYSPYLSFAYPSFATGGGIPGPPIGSAGLDTALAHDPNIQSGGSATIVHALTRRSSLEGYADLFRQTFVDSDSTSNGRSDQIVGGRYRYQFSRFAGLRAGYGFRRGTLGGPDDDTYSNHILDFGVDTGYGRAYALSRRTTFSFRVNSSLAVDEAIDPDRVDEFDANTRVFLGGNVDLTHAMGRTWLASAHYRRGLDYQVGFDQPILSNTVEARVGGLLSPRLDFTAWATYQAGSVGFSGPRNGYSSANANAALRLAISRNLAAFVQYFYYDYMFEGGVSLPNYLGSNLDRQGGSVGLTAWLPVIGPRGRR